MPNTRPVALSGAAARISKSREGPATPAARPMPPISTSAIQPGTTVAPTSSAISAAQMKDRAIVRSWRRARAARKPPSTMPPADASI